MSKQEEALDILRAFGLPRAQQNERSALTLLAVYITAFLAKADFRKYAGDIAWETEVWIAEAPDHMIHFNGPKFLGPYKK